MTVLGEQAASGMGVVAVMNETLLLLGGGLMAAGGKGMIDSVLKAHVLWARTDSELAFVIRESGYVCGLVGLLSGSIEVVAYRIARKLN